MISESGANGVDSSLHLFGETRNVYEASMWPGRFIDSATDCA
ncbi:MAG: hypothetical protein ACREA2_18190 [Blastocatellia bacterium]